MNVQLTLSAFGYSVTLAFGQDDDDHADGLDDGRPFGFTRPQGQ